MELSGDAYLTFEQLGRRAHLERLYLAEIARVVVDRAGGIALPDTDLADRKLFDVQEHTFFALFARSPDSPSEIYYMSRTSDVKEAASTFLAPDSKQIRL
jgi:hypothetical protein